MSKTKQMFDHVSGTRVYNNSIAQGIRYSLYSLMYYIHNLVSIKTCIVHGTVFEKIFSLIRLIIGKYVLQYSHMHL